MQQELSFGEAIASFIVCVAIGVVVTLAFVWDVAA